MVERERPVVPGKPGLRQSKGEEEQAPARNPRTPRTRKTKGTSQMRYCGESTLSKATSAATAAAPRSALPLRPRNGVARRRSRSRRRSQLEHCREIGCEPGAAPTQCLRSVVETVVSGRMPRCCAAISTAAPRLSTCSGRLSWSANIARRPSGPRTAKGRKHAAETATNAATKARAPAPSPPPEVANASGRRTAGQSLAAKPSPRSAPLRRGRSRTTAASPPSARRVGHRSKRVSKSEPRTSGEIPIASSAAHVRAVPASTALSAEAEAAMHAAPHDAHEHRERRRVAPAHVRREEHGRQRRRRVLELEVAIGDGAVAHELRVVDVDRDVGELALLDPADERVEREAEQGEATATAAQFVCSRRLDDVELFRDRRLLADQLRNRTEVRQLLVERDQPEAILRLVRDPDVAFRQLGRCSRSSSSVVFESYRFQIRMRAVTRPAAGSPREASPGAPGPAG